MRKHITVYEPNDLGEIEKIETVDGVVVNEGHESESFASKAWAWFFSGNHNQTVGGNEWEKKYKRASDGNGREYYPASGNLEYTNSGDGETRTIWEQLGVPEGTQLSDGYINMD